MQRYTYSTDAAQPGQRSGLRERSLVCAEGQGHRTFARKRLISEKSSRLGLEVGAGP